MSALNTLDTTGSVLCLVLSWFANLILFWLIFAHKKDGQLQAWSRVLLQSALLDIIVPLVVYCVQPVYLTEGQFGFGYLNGPFGGCKQSTVISLYFLQEFWLEFGKYAITIQFIYRWLVICREKRLSIGHYSLLLTVPASIAAFNVLVDVATWPWQSPTADSPSCAACPPGSTLLFAIPLDSPYLVGMFYSAVCYLGANLLTYLVIVICNLLIWRKTSRSLLPEHSREVSRQIGRVLLVQALLPLLFSVFPMTFFFVINETGVLQIVPEASSLILYQSWSSVIYPVATVLIVGKYRRTLFTFFCASRNGGSVEPRDTDIVQQTTVAMKPDRQLANISA